MGGVPLAPGVGLPLGPGELCNMPIKAGGASRNWEARTGDTWEAAFQWMIKNPDYPADSDEEYIPVGDLTGYTWLMQVRRTAQSTAVVLELSTENGYITMDPLESWVYFEVPYEVMETIPNGVYGYDLQYTTPAGKRKTLLFGKFKIGPEFSKASED